MSEEDLRSWAGGGSVLSQAMLSHTSAPQVEEKEDADHKENQQEAMALLDSNEAEKLVAKDLEALDHKERIRVYEEIHGVADFVEETPHMLQVGLEQMDIELSLARSRVGTSTSNMDKLSFLLPKRVQDWASRLVFLRSENFDAVKAAHRYIRYFDCCFELFGFDGLLRDIESSDLSQEENEILKTGSIQPLLRTKDRCDRPIFLFFNALGRYAGRHRQLQRVALYALGRALKDPAVQQKGFVWISWNVGLVPNTEPLTRIKQSIISQGIAFLDSIPWRAAAVHYCFDDTSKIPLINLLRLLVGPRGRVRFRTHFGDTDSCKRQLQGFGIDPFILPLATSQTASDEFHRWLSAPTAEERSKAEEEEQSTIGVVPRSTDVLLGRGKPFRLFPGNRDLNQQVIEQWETYDALPRREKSFFIDRFTQDITNRGTRFLKRKSPKDAWQEVAYAKIVEKIATSFRNKPLVDKYHEEQEARKHSKASATTTEGGGETKMAETSPRRSRSASEAAAMPKRLDWSSFPQWPPE